MCAWHDPLRDFSASDLNLLRGCARSSGAWKGGSGRSGGRRAGGGRSGSCGGGGPRDPDDPEKRRLLGLFLESGRGGAQGGSRYTAADASGAQVRSFEDLRKADPKLHYSFRYRGGWKSVSEAEALYEKVPSDVRAQGPDAVKSYLASRDASHIKARASGGPNTAENLEFECRNLNRQRNYDFRAGRRETPHMTPEELQAVRRANGSVQVLEVAKLIES